MPWRLIIFIIVFAVFICFISFNLENQCNISFGFKTFQAVPIFLTVFISFVLGMLCSLPFITHLRKKHNTPQLTRNKDSTPPEKEANIETLKELHDANSPRNKKNIKA